MSPGVEATVRVSQVGPYYLDEVLGRGSSGVVYRAFDEVSGELVAIKMLDPRSSADPAARARFGRECELVGAFSHPRLVRLRARGSTASGIDYLVMDLARGLTLHDRLGQSPGMTPHEGMQCILETAEGLAAMHRAGWVHRDVKPANVILGEDEQPRLLDFGLAARVGSLGEARLTRAGCFVGTPLYLAPEQLLCGPPGTTMDVYALGAMLFEVLTGTPPFTGPTEHLLVEKSRKEAPRYDGPAPIADLIAQALRRDPRERPPDAAAFASELRALLLPEDTQDLDAPPVPDVRPFAAQETHAFAPHEEEALKVVASPCRKSAPPPPKPTTPPGPRWAACRPNHEALVRSLLAAYAPPPARPIPSADVGYPLALVVALASGALAFVLSSIGRGLN